MSARDCARRVVDPIARKKKRRRILSFMFMRISVFD
jgi:hypothetical protein